MNRTLVPTLLIFTILLTACSTVASRPQSETQPAPVSNAVATPTDDPAILPTLFPNMAGNGEMTRTDQQGAVIVDVTPLNLGTPASELEFEVAMNTHSVDLNMDLATLATLTTDTGMTIPATRWDAPRGGHHVEGKLVFPATQDGKSILDGAGKLTLTILNVDADARNFEWELK
jgi:hypothetical protein